jgi:dephospho-CoA kinase
MPQSNAPLLIGITGNIGSGKSLVSSLIASQGYHLISADPIAKTVLDDPDLQVHLAEIWGAELLSQGKIDRQALAKLVFSHPDKLIYLNSLIHPRVLELFDNIVFESADLKLFFEIPLLFEAGLESCFDAIILVTAPQDQKLDWLIKRDNSNREQILARLRAQMPDSEKLARVDYVLENNGSIDELKTKTLTLLDKLQSLPPRDKMSFVEAGKAFTHTK